MHTAVHYIPEDLNVDRCLFANFEYSIFCCQTDRNV